MHDGHIDIEHPDEVLALLSTMVAGDIRLQMGRSVEKALHLDRGRFLGAFTWKPSVSVARSKLLAEARLGNMVGDDESMTTYRVP
jgi:hypothetical protein